MSFLSVNLIQSFKQLKEVYKHYRYKTAYLNLSTKTWFEITYYIVKYDLQVVETASDDSYSDEESPKKRRDMLSRRPSYRKILNDLGGGEIAGENYFWILK